MGCKFYGGEAYLLFGNVPFAAIGMMMVKGCAAYACISEVSTTSLAGVMNDFYGSMGIVKFY